MSIQTEEKRRRLPFPRRDKPKKIKPAAGQMTFFEHLGELRMRLIWSALAVAVGTSVCFVFSRDLVDLFIALAKTANPKVEIITTQLLQNFSVFLMVSVYAGIAMASPVIVYHLIAFLAPALEPESLPGQPGYEQELKLLKSIKRSLIIVIPAVAIFFVAGVAFAYYIFLPPAVKFLTNFPGDQIKPTLIVTSYVGDISKIMFWTGIVFEIPIVMFAVAKARIVTWKKFLSLWKFAIIISLVISAFINPSPEPVTQLVIAGPVMGLYLLGILFARFA